MDLDCPGKPLAIGSAKRQLRVWVTSFQFASKRFHVRIAPSVSHVIGDWGHGGKTSVQCVEVESRAPDNDLRSRSAHDWLDFAQPVPHRIASSAIDMAKQAMGHRSFFSLVRPGGQHAEVAVDLHRVRVHDRAAMPERPCDR